MTDFVGFKDADFDFWIDQDSRYHKVLRERLSSFSKIVTKSLPKKISSKYREIKPGKISKSGDWAWIAFKKTKNTKDKTDQCNFTIEVGKTGLFINAVIRNGHIKNKNKAIGVFYDRVCGKQRDFLKVLKSMRDASVVVSKRFPLYGAKIMPGNERWDAFFEMKVADIQNPKDVDYFCEILKKADVKKASPGIHIKYSIDRGEPILEDVDKLTKFVVKAIVKLEPVLAFIN